MKRRAFRDQQLARQIREELDLILASAADLHLSRLIVRDVIHQPGGSSFRAFVVPTDADDFPSCQLLLEVLERANGYLRSELARTLNLKRCPAIQISPDPVFLLARWGK